MKFTQLNDIEIGFADYQVAISSAYIHLLCDWPSKFVVTWGDGSYAFYSGGVGRTTTLKTTSFVVVWRKDEDREP